MANQLFDLLKQDHQEARLLMEQIVDAPQNQRHSLFIDLGDALNLHMQIEEDNFYPKLQNHKVLKPAQQEAHREHREAKELIAQLDRLDVSDAEWGFTFRLLQQGLLKHMQVEEGYVFEKCADFMSEQELNEIAQKCRQQKQSAQPAARGQQPESRV